MDNAELVLVDRYLALKQKAEDALGRMHPGMAGCCDLDGLEKLIGALERVALHGDRIKLHHAQSSRRSSAPGAEAPAEAEGAEDRREKNETPPGGEAAPSAEDWRTGDPYAHPPTADEGGEEGAGDAPADGIAAPEDANPGTAAAGAPGAAAPAAESPETGEGSGGPALVVAQKPPPAKPGRARGWSPDKPKPAKKALGKPAKKVAKTAKKAAGPAAAEPVAE